MGGLCRNFELEPLGHDLSASKGVGSNMAEGAVAAGRQSRGQDTPVGSRLTVPSSVSAIEASGLETLHVCV